MCRSFLVTVVPLVYFCFCSLCFWCYIQKSLTRPMPRSLPPKSSRSFTLSALTFKSLIHFEWFCEWYKTVVQFYFSACSFLVFWRDCPFPIECSWLSNDNDNNKNINNNNSINNKSYFYWLFSIDQKLKWQYGWIVLFNRMSVKKRNGVVFILISLWVKKGII